MFRLRSTIVNAGRALAKATTATNTVSRTTQVYRAVNQIRFFSTEQPKESGFWSDILRGKKAETTAEAKPEQAEQKAQTAETQQQAQQQQTSQQTSQERPQQQQQQQQQQAAAEQPAAAEAPKAEPPTVPLEVHEALKTSLNASKTEITRLQSILNEKDNKIKELKDSLLRELAEQENVRARATKDVQAARAYGVSSFAKNLLDVVDTLDMALIAANKSLAADASNEPLKQLTEGVEMTRKVFFKGLEGAGIKKFESLGQKVDPNLHFVAAQVPSPDAEPGTVTHIIKEGYMIQDRVLRPAQVAIASKPN